MTRMAGHYQNPSDELRLETPILSAFRSSRSSPLGAQDGENHVRGKSPTFFSELCHLGLKATGKAVQKHAHVKLHTHVGPA